MHGGNKRSYSILSIIRTLGEMEHSFKLQRVRIVGSSFSFTKFYHFLCGKYLCIFKDAIWGSCLGLLVRSAFLKLVKSFVLNFVRLINTRCFDEFVAMIKKIFDRASNINNENLMKFDILIRVLKHSILLKLGLHD